MGNIWKSFKLNSTILSCTLGIFTFTNLAPINALTEMNINVNDVQFGIRIQKLVEKLDRYKKKSDSKKLLETMFDIKSEVEGYTNKKINLEKSIDEVAQRVKDKGGKVDKRVIKQLKKNFKKSEKRANHKAMYMADCIEYDIPYFSMDEQILFNNTNAKHDDDKKDEKEINVPLRVTIGVSVTLCGVFLLFVPIPVCKSCGKYAIEFGLGLLVDHGITQWNDKEEEEPENNKK